MTELMLLIPVALGLGLAIALLPSSAETRRRIDQRWHNELSAPRKARPHTAFSSSQTPVPLPQSASPAGKRSMPPARVAEAHARARAPRRLPPRRVEGENLRLTLALLVPSLSFFTIGRPGTGFWCMFLRLFGMSKATAQNWATYEVNQWTTDRKIEAALDQMRFETACNLRRDSEKQAEPQLAAPEQPQLPRK
ncbi:MAG: hypothetical protein NZ533_11230 [Casimicrobiaceae bacterium]|nr:hypothetical protein [Casimicrobiaceae bacterium]MDW8312675.1 hypothetical protein [Burkholderiales bacterium]